MVYDRSLAVGGQVVRSEEPFAEIRGDCRHEVLDVAGLGQLPYFVYQQAVPISVESLTLSQPEDFLSFYDQSRISSPTRIDSYRVLRMRDPSGTQR